MGDYFSEYASFIGAKGLPSPADTPYETPSFIRSKRSSRATAGGSSREQSTSPPPLPPDATDVAEKTRDGRYTALDPRRFTPTLHASLVSEILNLRRELDSKNNLVENLESNLLAAKDENESLSNKLSENAKEVRRAKQQVVQIEQGTFSAVEDLAKARDLAVSGLDDLKTKLESAQKQARRQDEDAERTQRIWASEKESWDNERRQMERRLHVTEARLRTFVDEMSAHQAAAESQHLPAEEADESIFKDSGLGNESDAGSIRSMTPTKKHRRNASSLSYRRSLRHSTSTRSIGTPEPHAKPGHSLADELGIDEEDEYDLDEFEHGDEDLDYNEHLRRTMESRQSFTVGDVDAKAKRILGIASDSVEPTIASPTARTQPKYSDEVTASSDASKPSLENTSPPVALEPTRTAKVVYVDTGYQPSPPPSPPHSQRTSQELSIPTIAEPEEDSIADKRSETHLPRIETSNAAKVRSPISPPATPSVDSETWSEKKRDSVIKPTYSSTSTQTEFKDAERPKSKATNRDSLSPPMFVPSIAIHPPTSRPSSPRPYVLPPGTKNASTQASLASPSYCDSSMQTEGIRVDKRPVKVSDQPLQSNLLPSPTFEEPPPRKPSRRAPTGGSAIIFQKPAAAPPLPSLPSLPARTTRERAADVPRNVSDKDLRSMPLRAIPLPRPILAPTSGESEGPLNRSASYGVTQSSKRSSQLLDVDKDTDTSDNEEADDIFEDLAGTIPAFARPPHGRFGLSEPPKVVPEDKEISPERRPDTAGSYGAAPAPSVSSSRAERKHAKPPAKLNAYRDFRSRSPSLGSVGSSVYSSQSAAPPFPIPHRSSSRVRPGAHSEGSRSPTSHHSDVFGNRGNRGNRSHHSRQGSLRKVQSAAVIRHPARKASPTKSRRRRRHSPELTPVHSMAIESPAPTKFPIPDLPTPLQDGVQFDYIKGSVDLGRVETGVSSRRASEENGLVDAIAGTMVGEWMWKYVRKRKSFGVQEELAIAEDGSVNTAQHGGTRHKRWVWLSPYERTVMWDNKQPTTGNALLGKKGRKLAIQSVLDVQDDTPLPKDRELTSAFHRSILILTPQRALKFTTVSEERHTLWMTALSFLAQSGRLPSQIPSAPTRKPPPPPVPALPAEGTSTKRRRSPSFGRATVRDSIRLAKGKRPDYHKAVSYPEYDGSVNGAGVMEAGQPENQGADFPAVPRLYSGTVRHQRKRSNTSPRLPPPLNGFRSFSTNAVPSTASSALQPSLTAGTFSRPSASSKSGSVSARGSSLASPDRPNFFEAVGTVRMEAFVDPNVRDGVLYVPAPPPGPQARRHRGDSNFSQSTNDKRRLGYVFDEYGHDPFKNF